jgi:hypothetical protein
MPDNAHAPNHIHSLAIFKALINPAIEEKAYYK